jgi:hypothetical protein
MISEAMRELLRLIFHTFAKKLISMNQLSSTQFVALATDFEFLAKNNE